MQVTAQSSLNRFKLRRSFILHQNGAGFTLIELLIVIALLGILSTSVLVAVNPTKRASQARDAQRKTQLAQVKNALEAYMALKGSYPSTVDGEVLGVLGDMSAYGGKGYEGPDGYIPDLAPDFIKKLPQDPRIHTSGSKNSNCNSDQAGFLYKSDGTDYKFMAHCTPENYDDADKNFIDPARDGDSAWGEIVTPENCASQVISPGQPWAYAVWSSDVGRCF